MSEGGETPQKNLWHELPLGSKELLLLFLLWSQSACGGVSVNTTTGNKALSENRSQAAEMADVPTGLKMHEVKEGEYLVKILEEELGVKEQQFSGADFAFIISRDESKKQPLLVVDSFESFEAMKALGLGNNLQAGNIVEIGTAEEVKAAFERREAVLSEKAMKKMISIDYLEDEYSYVDGREVKRYQVTGRKFGQQGTIVERIWDDNGPRWEVGLEVN